MLGAQNISEKESGAYTGEISAKMVAEFCTHVILGHSERRTYYQETDSLINQKIKVAQHFGLVPILCIGEELSQREDGQTATVVSRQIKEGLKNIYLDDPQKIVIAYEPIWAIGSGKIASATETADLIASVIRPVLSGIWDENIAQGIRILYGGSVKPSNARSFFSETEIDGALVGGASLDAETFLGIIEKAS
jgi:triosephosphate isomerase